ncbi:cell wall-binding repeat-containing protein [Herbiconiux sp. A18JL235]|uniref:Cell wall-binding repeat-containing protein n=1 Tax=Herbiconiux sp. A18JL235 TaxID=3152363 RepID=A0AB39BI42_9MICO
MLRITLRSARATATVLLTGTALVAVSALGVAPASASTEPDPAGGEVLSAMPDFSLESYSAAAAGLPAELTEALAADVGESAEEYLAGADAAFAASAVIDGLEAQGVVVADSRLDGTTLVVTVLSDAEVPAVEAANAVAEVGEAPGRDRYADASIASFADLVGGQGYYFTDGSGRGYGCSTAFNGLDRSGGGEQFVTAGHCQGAGGNGRIDQIVENRPNDPDGRLGSRLGQQVAGSYRFGNEFDGGLVSTASGWNARGFVGTWNSGANNGAVTAGTPQLVRDYGDAVTGQTVCKSGRTTGWTCGKVAAVDQLVGVDDVQVNADIVRGLCSDHGDSGGAVVSGAYAMGLISGGTTDACSGGITAVFPMIGGSENGQPYGSIVTLATNWWLKVAAPGPAVNTVVGPNGLVTGTLPGGTGNYAVRIAVDGGEPLIADVMPDLNWNLTVPGLTPGIHSYTAYSTFGPGDAQSQSGSVSGSLFVGSVDRIAGADRYSGAVAIAQRAFPGTAPVVYVATGLNYPDALSAGPAAVAQGGPLLLVTQNEVPAVVADEIRSLQPERIVVVGGPNSVSGGVVATLKTLVPGVGVERLAGADRYAASRAVVSAVFPEAAHSFAATGTNFPDALSAGGAAGSALEPVVLVNGSQPAADKPTLDLFRDLKAQSITVVGGPNSVSSGVADSLKTVPAAVDRVSAENRYLTSIALNRASFETSSTVYLATGLNFPDALAGGVLAGLDDAPLYVVPTDCVPQGVLSDIGSLGATEVVLLGGPNSLTPAVQKLTACAS